ALAKRPEDRWPTVTDFVRGLVDSVATPVRASAREPNGSTVRSVGAAVPAAPGSTVAEGLVAETPPPLALAETISPVSAFVPPEETGPGSLQPTLVVGLGQGGLRVLQRFRFDLAERYGPPETIPLIRT